jgi:GNAT superfamily N-acetyltransferase
MQLLSERNLAPIDAVALPLAQWPAVIRALWPFEIDEFQRHLQRLDGITRIERFGRGVADEWLAGYCRETDWLSGVVVGCWIQGTLRGVGEIRRDGARWRPVAEAALSIERPFQNRGLGSLLTRRLLVAARNRGLTRLQILTQASNLRMLHILRREGAALRFAGGDQIEGMMDLAPASAATFAEEWMEEAWARMRAPLG